MEFKFAVNDIFKAPMVEIGHNLIPPGFSGDRRSYWDTVAKVSEVINAMGEASAAAQGLTKPITSAERLRNSEQTIYLLIDQNAANGRGAVTGMLKTGKKGLYVFDRNGQHFKVSPPCVLDFYVHESRQRTGLGKRLFEHMLQKESIDPVNMAIDRPSEKFLGFLNKHYTLDNPVKQMNNYVVFDGFFPRTTERNGTVEVNESVVIPSRKQSANGLQTSFSSPMGRYGAPRPACSMGQIIHNQTSTIQKPAEAAGVQSLPATNYQNYEVQSPQNATQVSQSTPNMYYPAAEAAQQNRNQHTMQNCYQQQQSNNIWQSMGQNDHPQYTGDYNKQAGNQFFQGQNPEMQTQQETMMQPQAQIYTPQPQMQYIQPPMGEQSEKQLQQIPVEQPQMQIQPLQQQMTVQSHMPMQAQQLQMQPQVHNQPDAQLQRPMSQPQFTESLVAAPQSTPTMMAPHPQYVQSQQFMQPAIPQMVQQYSLPRQASQTLIPPTMNYSNAGDMTQAMSQPQMQNLQEPLMMSSTQQIPSQPAFATNQSGTMMPPTHHQQQGFAMPKQSTPLVPQQPHPAPVMTQSVPMMNEQSSLHQMIQAQPQNVPYATKSAASQHQLTYSPKISKNRITGLPRDPAMNTVRPEFMGHIEGHQVNNAPSMERRGHTQSAHDAKGDMHEDLIIKYGYPPQAKSAVKRTARTSVPSLSGN